MLKHRRIIATNSPSVILYCLQSHDNFQILISNNFVINVLFHNITFWATLLSLYSSHVGTGQLWRTKALWKISQGILNMRYWCWQLIKQTVFCTCFLCTSLRMEYSQTSQLNIKIFIKKFKLKRFEYKDGGKNK